MAGNIKGVTIEFRGETTKLQSALNTLRKETRSLDQELKQIDRALKFNPGNTELVAQKQTVLKEKVQQTKKSLDELRDAQAQMDAEGIDKNSEAYRRVQREIIETESKLKHYEQQLEKLDRIKFEKLGKSLQDVGDKMESIGKGMSKYVTAPIVAAAAGATKAWKDVDEGLDIVTQKTGATGDALKEMHNIVKDLSGEVPADFNDIGSAVGEVNTRFGVTGDKLQELSKKYLEFAQLNDTDVSTAVDKSQKALRAWNLDVDDAGPLLDTLNKVGQDTGVSMDSLMDSMVKNAPALQQMNLSWDQAAVFLGQVEVSGVDADKALAGLNKALVKGAKEGKEFPEVMHDLQTGIKGAKTDAEAMSIASEYFGTKAGPALAQAIRNGTINLEEMSNMSVDAKGNLEKTFEETLDPADKFQLILNQLKVLGYDVADTLYTMLGPAIKKALEFSQNLRKKWEELSPTMQKVILKIAGVAAAIGPLLVAGGKLTKGIGQLCLNYSQFGTILPGLSKAITGVTGVFGKLFGVLAANPIILIVAAIAALVAAIIYLWTHSEKFREFWINLWNNIKEIVTTVVDGIKNFLTTAWEAITSTVKTVWGSIAEFFTTIFEGIKNTVETVWNAIKTVIETIINIIKTMIVAEITGLAVVLGTIWYGIQTAATAVWDQIKGFVLPIVEAIKEGVHTAFETLKSILEVIWTGIKTAAELYWKYIQTVIINPVRFVVEKIKEFFTAAKEFLTNTWNTIKTTASNVWNAIKENISKPVSAASDKVKNVFNTLKSFLSSAWSSIKSTASNTWNAIKEACLKPVETLRDKIKAIIDKIKGFFNFTVKTPKIPLPHFSISPSGWSINDLLDGSIPHLSVDWYAKGAIFDKPTIFRGVGEAGPEAVLPLDTLWQRLDTMADSIVNGIIMGLRTTQLQGAGGDITIPIYLYPSGPKMGEETVKAYDKYKKILG